MEEIMLFFILCAILVLTGLLGFMAWKAFRKKKSTVLNSSILLNSVERVFKMVTVEGNYSEVLQYKEKHHIFFDLIPQEKKALVVVKGKVLMGMDMKKAAFNSDESAQTITLESLPAPEIIGLETDVEYYDMSSSMLKSFKADELTKLQAQAKALIRTKADEGHLRLTAENQAAQIMDVVRAMVEQSGWKFQISSSAQKLLDGEP